MKGPRKGSLYAYTRRWAKLPFSLLWIRTCIGWMILGKNNNRKENLSIDAEIIAEIDGRLKSKGVHQGIPAVAKTFDKITIFQPYMHPQNTSNLSISPYSLTDITRSDRFFMHPLVKFPHCISLAYFPKQSRTKWPTNPKPSISLPSS